MDTNEYLQTELFGEKIKPSRKECKCACHKPNYIMGWDSSSCFGKGDCCSVEPRDFSLPKDYCALEDKMRELGEWTSFLIWWQEEYWNDECDVVQWMNNTHTQRADLVAEYLQQKEESK